jgi:flagellar hook protein FlgE
VTYTKTGTNTWSYSISMPQTVTANSTTAAGVTTTNYNFGSSGGTLATVNTGTNLVITGPTTGGTAATITAPTVTAGETVAAYATALGNAVTAAGITGVTVSSNAAGQLSVVGTNISTSGSVVQDPIATKTTGTLSFDSSGNLVAPAANVSGISFSGLSDGAANMNLTFDILGTSGSATITQTDAASGQTKTAQNGYPSGEYQSFSIAADGTVEANYSNGQQLAVGQLALANVANQNGLELLGGGDFQATTASGAPTTGVSGSAGLGTFEDSNLEESNVNISTEFSNLIIAQRAFESNSKAITTFDTIAQETINMIH